MNKKIITITILTCIIFLLTYIPLQNNNQKYFEVTYVENTSFEEEKLSIEPTEEEIKLLAQFIKHEASNEDTKAKLTVGLVILNRVNSPAFPTTIQDVIYSPGYFSLPEAGLENIEITDADLQLAKKVFTVFKDRTPITDENGQNLINAFYWYAPNYTTPEKCKELETKYPVVGQIGERRFLGE